MTRLSLQDALEIQAKLMVSPESGEALAHEYRASRETVRRIATGDFFNRKDDVMEIDPPVRRRKSLFVPTSKWTQDLVLDLERMWDEGLSASEIAAELKTGFTRCAVLGKAHRLGLDARAERCSDPRELEERKKRAAASQVEAHRRTRGTVSPAAPRGPQANASITFDKPEPLNLTFAEIGRFDCRWIENEDMAAPLYCGHAVVEGLSWCPHHHARVKPPKREISEQEQTRRQEWGRTLAKARMASSRTRLDLSTEEAA